MPACCCGGTPGGVSFFGVLNCLAGLAQSGAIAYQSATNPSVARAVVTGQNSSQGVSTNSLLLIGLVIVGGYLLLRKK